MKEAKSTPFTATIETCSEDWIMLFTGRVLKGPFKNTVPVASTRQHLNSKEKLQLHTMKNCRPTDCMTGRLLVEACLAGVLPIIRLLRVAV